MPSKPLALKNAQKKEDNSWLGANLQFMSRRDFRLRNIKIPRNQFLLNYNKRSNNKGSGGRNGGSNKRKLDLPGLCETRIKEMLIIIKNNKKIIKELL